MLYEEEKKRRRGNLKTCCNGFNEIVSRVEKRFADI